MLLRLFFFSHSLTLIHSIIDLEISLTSINLLGLQQNITSAGASDCDHSFTINVASATDLLSAFAVTFSKILTEAAVLTLLLFT